MDDMLINIKEARTYIIDLMDMFTTLIEYGMKLNPDKCNFKISSGKFFNYMVTN